MTNIVQFPNPDELEIFAFEPEDEEDQEYDRGHDLGDMMRAKYLAEAELVTAGMTDAEICGFWEGFYG
jgi:hypothetical protein